MKFTNSFGKHIACDLNGPEAWFSNGYINSVPNSGTASCLLNTDITLSFWEELWKKLRFVKKELFTFLNPYDKCMKGY